MRPHLVLAATAALLSLIPAIASSQANGTPPSRRWGIGWDDGVAARYFVRPDWGVGLRVSPRLQDNRGHESTTSIENVGHPSDYDHQDAHRRRTEDIAWTFGALAFRDFRITGGFRAGPYATLAYGYSSYTSEARTESRNPQDPLIVESSGFSRTTIVTNSVTAGIGIRPSLVIRDRILLEARFGIYATRSWNDQEERNESMELGAVLPETRTYHSKEHNHTWNFGANGDDVPAYTTLQLILLL